MQVALIMQTRWFVYLHYKLDNQKVRALNWLLGSKFVIVCFV